MKKILRRWILRIILNGQISESNDEFNCFICQYKISELERRIDVLVTKQARLKQKVNYFLKKFQNLD
ncbi:MAG: hypothetical protein A3I88_01575 [Candidatus Portnoybacteria bacterium RIFCSPLOWO2_12_FULL_39_9]|uniref:Uncharacterized protein n=1 Tax=Candidatus Portnoybacteria bacterium RIFCSPHIGHO2_12_FULL_38_9 TaxID=1801997 RepID=A0A1G2FGH2_9BACT|nr:MAG: hypothetical protein A3H00_00065 [Candidatus Portnoybacteria bacterium RBG_13_40_8]OGZ35288.1 MAG: hypothetical protein A2646_02115 [Candidatus Portnoybacteria bacterium RIFCSPHIGHO2_02_FULL_39_12]OGZ36902.1 MAG: hypothetical protein A3J64_03655 [Candidatus Portnoybacteria bacterium RIFCSPHIGHO2_12_FULL_38_9]OGZ38729.1 MAG: hypothetical protein A3F21_01405 [Candidatus Portnoybacteria bacterium RIFCSPLOWO2_01_FULL_38_39]OGZ40584.1 MAG: hypothetical protein A3I88_01575 [Candidatus Portnoy